MKKKTKKYNLHHVCIITTAGHKIIYFVQFTYINVEVTRLVSSHDRNHNHLQHLDYKPDMA